MEELRKALEEAARESRKRGGYDVAALLEELAYQAETGKLYPSFIKGWPYQ